MSQRGPRSSPYPSYTIQYCLDLVTTIYTNFGSGNYYAKREEIAKVLGISAANLQTKVSSANQYGLLELKSGEGYKPSKLFTSIHRPIDDKSKKAALIEVFKSPSLYASLIEKFEGEILPSEGPLSNILLHHHNISDGANVKAADIFIENARSLNLIKQDNVLMLADGVIIEEVEAEELNEDQNVERIKDIPAILTEQKQPPNSNGSNQNRPPVNSIPFNIPLKGKSPAQLIVPENAKGSDFDFIVNFINLMRQQFE